MLRKQPSSSSASSAPITSTNGSVAAAAAIASKAVSPSGNNDVPPTPVPAPVAAAPPPAAAAPAPPAAAPAGSVAAPPQTGLKSNQEELPPEREKLVTRREGFSYQLVTIEHQRGCKFGLGIKHYQNKVIVSRVDDGSLSAKSLIAGDRIIDINGVPVSDKDVARDLLLKSLQKTRKVSLIVERAVSDDAIAIANAALLASEQQPPSVAMASDIRDIVARQREKMNKTSTGGQKKGGIMRKGASNANKVQIGEEKKEHVIASDNEGKALKKVAANAK